MHLSGYWKEITRGPKEGSQRLFKMWPHPAQQKPSCVYWLASCHKLRYKNVMQVLLRANSLLQKNYPMGVGAHIFERRFDSACCTVGGPHKLFEWPMAWYDSPLCNLCCVVHFLSERMWIFCSPEMHTLFTTQSKWKCVLSENHMHSVDALCFVHAVKSSLCRWSHEVSLWGTLI
jgi:hypothetical protein